MQFTEAQGVDYFENLCLKGESPPQILAKVNPERSRAIGDYLRSRGDELILTENARANVCHIVYIAVYIFELQEIKRVKEIEYFRFRASEWRKIKSRITPAYTTTWIKNCRLIHFIYYTIDTIFQKVECIYLRGKNAVG